MRSSPSATRTWRARFWAPRGRGWWRWWGWRMWTASRRRYCARLGGATRGRGCAREVHLPEGDCCGARDHSRRRLVLADGGATSRAAARAMRHVVVQPSPFREGAVNIRATVLFLRPDSVWAWPDTVNRAPNLPKWGLPGRGSNLLKSPADPVCLLLPPESGVTSPETERGTFIGEHESCS